MKKIILITALLSLNAFAGPSGDSTSININGYRQALQQQGSTGAYNGQSRAVSVPNQTIYVIQPTQTTYVTQNGTVQCSFYKTVQSNSYSFPTAQQARNWGGCGNDYTGDMPAGTVRINSNPNACQASAWGIPIFVTVCGG